MSKASIIKVAFKLAEQDFGTRKCDINLRHTQTGG